MTTTSTRDRAIVLGGSIAGLLAARVLSDRYDEVVVVERDGLQDDDDHPRRGTPQARHLHGLLARGLEQLEALFPGLASDLTASGVPCGDMLAHSRLSFGGYRFAQGDSGLAMLCADRPVLEQDIRRRVEGLANVGFLRAHDVVGLVADAGARRVRGVRVVGRQDGGAGRDHAADLVVDATGRGSRMPVWLETFGHERPTVQLLHVGVGYASRRYRLPAGVIDNDLVILSGPTPKQPRGGALSRLGGDQCLVTLMGVLGNHPPTDPEDFIRFAADLALPDVHRAILDAEPLDDPVAYRHPTSVRARYDQLASMPEGVVVLGDAVCSLNPIYGQGMTVAALEAAALGRHLDQGTLRPHRFQRDVAKVVNAAWALSSGADLTFPGVSGRRTAMAGLLGRYVARIQAGASSDPALGRAFLRVTSMVDPPQALLRPKTLMGAVSASLRT
ncbi:NAD(P)/FAD-dependent oxidoreductase [Nocardioides sp. zg-1230]|uniref:FAD-dependent oxidoreductase n=1 Tax=Nocardioides sp. zg-1230 TaxID=2736601 RepID=UPI0015568217|nr:FAD-dependent monooxygenase [Nocardioides sp. zg-1230]NPC43340.1 FAD-binding monooxygenase [Nocardioides sp. zg-1230]NPC44756.1 FAD-binding monooxygenase [Nocardioides sp. zg-1230]